MSHKAQLFLVALLFFSLPISIAAANISLVVCFLVGVVLVLLPNRNFHSNVNDVRLLLTYFTCYFFVFLSATYNSADFFVGAAKSLTYIEFLAVPFLAYFFFRTKSSDIVAINSFSAAMLLTLIFSYITYFDFFQIFNYLNLAKFMLPPDSSNPVVFKLHITQNFFMVLAIFLWLYKATRLFSNKKILAILYFCIALLGLFNIFFMVQGRTGQLIFLIICTLYIVERFKVRNGYIGLLLLIITTFLIYIFSPNFQERICSGFSEMQSWTPFMEEKTSMGLRLDYIYLSLTELFKISPWFGNGVGSFATLYEVAANARGVHVTINPHNQYILILIELGLFGLFGFFALNFVSWRSSYKLPYFWAFATRAILLSYAFANLFNSFLYDAVEGLFFSVFMALAFSHLRICEKFDD